MSIKVDDKVVHRSGGPTMTVREVLEAPAHGAGVGAKAWCEWTADDGGTRRAQFWADNLVPAPEKQAVLPTFGRPDWGG